MNEEQFKNMLLKCAKDKAFMCKLREILSGSIEFENLISNINYDIDRTGLNSGNPYPYY